MLDITPISGTSFASIDASDALPRGANARFVAVFVPVAISWPFGGPPHMPRCGLSHVNGPVHGCRIA